MSLDKVLEEVRAERERQDARFGVQDWPSWTTSAIDAREVHIVRDMYGWAVEEGRLTWREILDEEVAEVYAARTDEEKRRELVQVAAVAVAEIQAIDRRGRK